MSFKKFLKPLLALSFALLIALTIMPQKAEAGNSLTKPVIKKITYAKGGKATLNLKKADSKALGYEIQFYSYNDYKYGFKQDYKPYIRTITVKKSKSSVKTAAITGLSKGQKYFVRLRSYGKDETGKKIYSSWSQAKITSKITKGVTEASLDSVKVTLDAVNISSQTKLLVKASISKRIKSYDDYYYLVRVNPNTNAYDSVVAKVLKPTGKSTIKFSETLRTKKGDNLTEGKYAVAIKTAKSTYKLITGSTFINNPEAAAKYTKPINVPASKKGRQGCYDSSIGDKHYFFNLDLSHIVQPKKAAGSTAYVYNGKTYYFATEGYIDTIIRAVNKDGGTVTAQINLGYANILNYNSDVNYAVSKMMLPAAAESMTGKKYAAFNIIDADAVASIEAIFSFLAEYYSQPDLHIDNWILGNEVNTYANPIGWYWTNGLDRNSFIYNYASTFRMLYYAVKTNSANARVYVCCDHTWKDRDGHDWGAAGFLTAFNNAIKAQNANIQWNVAYHPYSAVLTNADVWNDLKESAIYKCNHTAETDFVSMANIEVLTSFVKTNFGSDCRIILSEVGFSATKGDNPDLNGHRQGGTDVQAAAVAYSFYKAQFNDMIDAIIFAHATENLNNAGQSFSFINRPAYTTYTNMDKTPQSFSYWTTADIPGWDASLKRK